MDAAGFYGASWGGASPARRRESRQAAPGPAKRWQREWANRLARFLTLFPCGVGDADPDRERGSKMTAWSTLDFALIVAALTSAALAGLPDGLDAQQRVDPFADVVRAGAPAAEAFPLEASASVGPWSDDTRPVRRLADALTADDFETSGFAQFMASPAGRIVRGVAGAAMIGGGIAMDDTGGTVLAVAGAVPLSAGIFDLCYASALFGGPLRGEEIRAAGR